MIRRDSNSPNGTSHWVLIPQIEHALLAGKLAAEWGAEPFAPVAPYVEMMEAIFGHDDGWAAWDSRPNVDPQSGIPLAFNEMPLAESLAIWKRSIQDAKNRSGLGGYAVAGHFCRLLRRFDSWNKDPYKQSLAIEFLACHENEMAAQLARWKSGDHPDWTLDVAAKAVAYVQLFDAMSLWLCCAERTAPERFQPPEGLAVVFTPQSHGQIEVSPWPWTLDSFEVGVTGRRIVAQRYASSAARAEAPSEELRLTWHFQP